MNTERNTMYQNVIDVNPTFSSLSTYDKFLTLLCPKSAIETKLISRFIKCLVDERKKTGEL